MNIFNAAEAEKAAEEAFELKMEERAMKEE
jgi:hypothetical protein